MASDRARRSYDAGRMYRSVVSQQGRVTIDADANEAEEIRAGESRAEALDVIGPTGTPDDGFKISVPGKGPLDFAIGHGCLYLGGVRVSAGSETTTYLGQRDTEWADYPAGAPFSDPLPGKGIRELVYLAVTEQEVSAVEDPALREVALGGPDTAQRTRLIQRVLRAPMIAKDCETTLAAVLEKTSPGVLLDPDTMQLAPRARLTVDFVPVSGGADPCQPTSQAGFLGAENQLIRVEVTRDRALVWGFDNASFMYRAQVTSPTTLSLQGTPVDVYHWPQAKQWVDVLATAVTLGDDAFVASASGVTREVASYDADGNVLTLSTALPAGLVGTRMFVRMWEMRVPFVGDGATAMELVTAAGTSTGVRVVTTGPAEPGDYWMIGVRPATPQSILPARLTAQPQPPDGPSRWATPLAVISWNADNETASIHDCRRPFDNLVDLTRHQCCELKVRPGDDAQAMIDERIQANAARGITELRVRFAPGVFSLDAPLVIASLKRGNVTVSGCGTTLNASTQEMALVLKDWDSASVLDLSVAAAIAKPGKGARTRPERTPPDPGDEFRHLGGAITFANCGTSVAEGVIAACGSGDVRAASCVTVRNGARGGDVLVRSCALSVGVGQVGVLLVNVNRATVTDNQIGSAAPIRAAIPNFVLKRWLISDLRFIPESPTKKRAPKTVKATSLKPSAAPSRVNHQHTLPGGQVLSFVTDQKLSAAWAHALTSVQALIVPASNTKTKRHRPIVGRSRLKVQRVLASMVSQIINEKKAGPLEAAVLAPFHDWLGKATNSQLFVSAGGQGIVVAGVRAHDVRVLNNTIENLMDGIHIGLSARRIGKPLFADRVQVVGNTVEARVPWYERRAHAGIFLGNVHVATVRDNHVEIQSQSVDVTTAGIFAPSNDKRVNLKAMLADVTGFGYAAGVVNDRVLVQLLRRIDAIRVWGMPGAMLLVTGNSSQQAGTGVHIKHTRGPRIPSMCLVTQNVAVGATVAIDAPDATVAQDNVPWP